MKTLVVAERKGSELRRVTLELAAKAAELGESTVVEIAGERYSCLPFVSALAKKVESEKPDLVLLGATLNGRDLGARLADGIPVGVVTALIGAPFFLWLLRRARLRPQP